MTITEPTWPHPTAIEMAIYDGVVEALEAGADGISAAVAAKSAVTPGSGVWLNRN